MDILANLILVCILVFFFFFFVVRAVLQGTRFEIEVSQDMLVLVWNGEVV